MSEVAISRLRLARVNTARAQAVLDAAHAERRDAVTEARAAGMTLRAIAAELGITWSRIHQITKGGPH